MIRRKIAQLRQFGLNDRMIDENDVLRSHFMMGGIVIVLWGNASE
jgi:hypothetical protein